MSKPNKTKGELVKEIQELRVRLEEAEEALGAIRSGEVDALVVYGNEGEQIFTLQGAEHPYRIMVETMNEGAATLMNDGIVLYGNRSLASMLNVPLENMIGFPLVRFVVPDDIKTFEALLQQVKKGSCKGEVTFKCEDETLVPVQLSMSLLQVNPEIQSICVVITDLTEQKRNEETVAAEQLARSILDQVAEAVVVCDVEGRIIRASQTAYQLCGQNPLFKPFETVFPLQLEDKGHSLKDFLPAAVLRGEVLKQVESRLEHNPAVSTDVDGIVNLLVSAAPLRDLRNKIVGGVFSLTDITDRKRTEETLRKSEERLQLALWASGGGAWDWDMMRDVAEVSDSYRELYGIPAGEPVTYAKWLMLVHPEDRERCQAYGEEIFRAGTEYQIEFRIHHPERGLRWLEGIGRVERDVIGRPVRFTGINFDITDRKQAEEQIKTSLREKEMLIKEIHHRVKNNLQIISSLLNLQSRTITDKQASEKFRDSQNRIKSMALIHEKLYQSRDLAGINFREYIKSLTNHLFRSYSTNPNIKLNIDVDNVRVDIDKAIPCGLIINELVSNALKHAFTEKKEGEVRVRLHLNDDKDGSGNLCTLAVSNNGSPFPEDFDFQNSQSLGLQLVCALTDQLRGTIELGKSGGTEFRIMFRI